MYTETLKLLVIYLKLFSSNKLAETKSILQQKKEQDLPLISCFASTVCTCLTADESIMEDMLFLPGSHAAV